MRLSNGFVIDKEKTFGELKFTAVRDVFLQNEDGTPSTQLKKRIYDLKCSLHGGIIPVCVPPEVPLREFPYNAVGIPYVCLKCFIKGMKQSIYCTQNNTIPSTFSQYTRYIGANVPPISRYIEE